MYKIVKEKPVQFLLTFFILIVIFIVSFVFIFGTGNSKLVDTSTAGELPPISAPSGTQWQLKFSDEFNGTSLDTAKWEPSWFAGNKISVPINSEEDGCYDPAQVSVSSGTLKLAAVATTNPNCKHRSGTAQYASGLVNTRLSYTFSYGYIEARMYMPGSNGQVWNWPAFWTDGTGNWPVTGEIDIMEGLEGDACWHYHYQDSNGNHQGPGGCPNFDGIGWHTYAAYWEPGKIRFYYDGVLVGTQTAGVVSAKQFIILNYGLNANFIAVKVPATVEFDYVRVWQSVAGSSSSSSSSVSSSSSSSVSSSSSNSSSTSSSSTSSSSSSTSGPKCKSDYNNTGVVDIEDFSNFAANYKKTGISCSLDLIGNNCYLDINDFSEFSLKYKNQTACKP